MVSETFATEQYCLRIKNGKDSDALLAGIRSYTLLRLHKLMRVGPVKPFCASIAAEIGDKVLSKE